MAVDLAGPRARILAGYQEAMVLRDWTLSSADMQNWAFTGDVHDRHPIWSRMRPLTLEVPIPQSASAWRWVLTGVTSLDGDTVTLNFTGMPERIIIGGGSGLGPASPPAEEAKPWDRGSSNPKRSGWN